MPLSTQQATALVDQAIASGIPLDQIDRFLNQNPGDEARIISALSSDQAADPGAAREADRVAFGYDARGVPGPSAPQWAYANQSSLDPRVTSGAVRSITMNGNGRSELVDAQLLSTASTATPTDIYGVNSILDGDTIGAEGWRDILGILAPVAGLIPGIGPILGPALGLLPGAGPQLPLPIPRPQLPAPRLPAPRPTIPITIPGRRGSISAGTMAKIAAAAAALGITVEEYIDRYGVPRKRPTMNPLNPRALRRAGNRVEKFACFAKKMIHFTETHRLKGVKKGCGKRRAACR